MSGLSGAFLVGKPLWAGAVLGDDVDVFGPREVGMVVLSWSEWFGDMDRRRRGSSSPGHW